MKSSTYAAFIASLLALLAACAGESEDQTTTPEPDAGGGEDVAAGDVTSDVDNNDASDSGPGEPYAGYTSAIYANLDNWMCHPESDGDVCSRDLDYTVVEADGTTRVVAHERAVNPEVDCLYFYPTASADPTGNSDLIPGPEEIFVTETQLAPLTEVCRTFAPVYRQGTLAALFGLTQDTRDDALSYGDVLDAWKHYIAHENNGRGVILVGHSQGAFHLRRLIAEEIENQPTLHDRLVAAYLIGAPVEIPEGEEVGASFQNTPVCRSADQTGCVLSYMSFRDTAPPPDNSIFGRAGGGNVAVCNHPAALDGGRAVVSGRFPREIVGLFAFAVSATQSPFTDPDAQPELTTDYFTMPGLMEAECVVDGEFSYLAVSILGDPSDPRADDFDVEIGPEWGLHLVDTYVTTNDLIEMARSQIEAYLALP